AMLAHARRLTAEERLANLFFVRGDAQRLPFPAACFDLVNCCGALHLFPEPARALAEVSRVLRLHGRFAATPFRALTTRHRARAFWTRTRVPPPRGGLRRRSRAARARSVARRERTKGRGS